LTGDVAAAARLVSYAATPRAQPARDASYAELVARYLAEPGFAEVADDVAAGLGLNLSVDQVSGVVAFSEPDGPFRRRLGDIIKSSAGRTMDETRLLFGLTLLGVARNAFPRASHLLDPTRVAQINPEVVVAYLDRLSEELGAGAGDAEANRTETEEGWRAWAHLREIRSGMARYSVQEKMGLVRRVCTFLEEEGHLVRQGDSRDAWWRTTPRFRRGVYSLLTDSETVPALRAIVAVDFVPAGDVDPDDLP
jgi:hypothetical protein